MKKDSLVLSDSQGKTYIYHRKANAHDVNAAARAAAQKQANRMKQELK